MLILGVGFLKHYLNTDKAKHEIIEAASKVCTSLKVETPRVCYGIINLMIVSVPNNFILRCLLFYNYRGLVQFL